MRIRRTALVLMLATIAAQASAGAKDWTTLTGCRLVDHPANDGDSFHVRHESKTNLFRLYFVDCPETSRQVPSRARRQAEYWETEEDEIPERGKDAAKFTQGRLRGPFVVHTRWQDAKGKSRAKRYFAFVTTHAEEDLATELVQAGHARAYGASIEHPDGTSTRATWKRLDALEEEAKEEGRGCWRR